MPNRNFGTFTIISIMAVVFVLMEMMAGSRDTATLVQFGALWGPLVWEGQYWRLISAIFLHIGLVHLLMNSFALWIWGQQIENYLGTWRYILLFIFSGLGGNLLSIFFDPMVLSAGASGGIFGLFAAQLYFFRRAIGRWEPNLLIYAAFMLLFGFVVPGINGWAHLGGAIAGFVSCSLLLGPRIRHAENQSNWQELHDQENNK